MPAYSFDLLLAGKYPDTLAIARQLVFTSAGITTVDGEVMLRFREYQATSLKEAVELAITRVESAGFQVDREKSTKPVDQKLSLSELCEAARLSLRAITIVHFPGWHHAHPHRTREYIGYIFEIDEPFIVIQAKLVLKGLAAHDDHAHSLFQVLDKLRLDDADEELCREVADLIDQVIAEQPVATRTIP